VITLAYHGMCYVWADSVMVNVMCGWWCNS